MDSRKIEEGILEAARKLRSLLDAGPVIWWVGAGVSMDAQNADGDHYPSWEV